MLFIRKNWEGLQQKAVFYSELLEKQLLLEKIGDSLSCALGQYFSILGTHSKEKDCFFRKKLFSASCNLA